jgi:hypothetical protein
MESMSCFRMALLSNLEPRKQLADMAVDFALVSANCLVVHKLAQGQAGRMRERELLSPETHHVAPLSSSLVRA